MPCFTTIDNRLKNIKNRYTGIITKDDLAVVWKQLLSLKEFTLFKYNLLSDYRDSSFEISVKEGDKMLNFLLSIKDILCGKKEAALLKNPKDTALSMLLQMKAYEQAGYEVQLFSTEKAALEWIINMDEN